FASLERARDAVRELIRGGQLPEDGVTIWLHAGDYVRKRALELTPADSGTADGPVIWRAYRDDRVRLLGGRVLTGFQPVTEPEVLARFDEGVRGQ
ncbi:MAG TPA: right-handed parallel beta-helix repeat-containing protein, partial [Verrucomicrobiales bacterium]|nr:right-handed parallel beta-helix repeat-containing protein [Verrucomicrobiales bacterium]